MHTVNRPHIGEINGLPEGSGQAYHSQWANARTVDWSEPHLRVVRFRLLSDPGLPFWDVSYCLGVLASTGEHVRVELPFDQLPKRGWRRAVVQHAIRDKVYAQGLGLFDNVSTLC